MWFGGQNLIDQGQAGLGLQKQRVWGSYAGLYVGLPRSI